MKVRHVEAYRTDARAILQAVNARCGQDFFSLSSTQVDRLLAYADARRYQKPKNATGSRAMCFYRLIQRRAHENAAVEA